jgi:hypothetical protein
MALAQDNPLGPIEIFDILHFLDQLQINTPKSSIFFLVTIHESIKVIDKQFIVIKSERDNRLDITQVIVEKFVSQRTQQYYTKHLLVGNLISHKVANINIHVINILDFLAKDFEEKRWRWQVAVLRVERQHQKQRWPADDPDLILHRNAQVTSHPFWGLALFVPQKYFRKYSQ